jgi:hypothetical protein
LSLDISILILRHLRKPEAPGGRQPGRVGVGLARVFNEAGPEPRPGDLCSRFALHPYPGVQGRQPRFTRKGPHRIEVHLPDLGELQHQLGE